MTEQSFRGSILEFTSSEENHEKCQPSEWEPDSGIQQATGPTNYRDVRWPMCPLGG